MPTSYFSCKIIQTDSSHSFRFSSISALLLKYVTRTFTPRKMHAGGGGGWKWSESDDGNAWLA